MPTTRAVRRPKKPAANMVVLDDATPGLTAQAFRAVYYPPARRLHHDGGRFFVHNDGGLRHAPVAHECIEAQIYRFLCDAVDSRGEPFHPTQQRVEAVMWSLARQVQWIYVPVVPADPP